MRVILDTNVLLSGLLISRGAPAELLDAWQRNLFTLVASDALIAEFREVANRPFFKARIRPSSTELLAAGIRDFSYFCVDAPSQAVAPDPKESYLLALSETSTADFLVTGDKELRSLKRHKSTRIVSPTAMLEIIERTKKARE
jgi:uncharacterized protein